MASKGKRDSYSGLAVKGKERGSMGVPYSVKLKYEDDKDPLLNKKVNTKRSVDLNSQIHNKITNKLQNTDSVTNEVNKSESTRISNKKVSEKKIIQNLQPEFNKVAETKETNKDKDDKYRKPNKRSSSQGSQKKVSSSSIKKIDKNTKLKDNKDNKLDDKKKSNNHVINVQKRIKVEKGSNKPAVNTTKNKVTTDRSKNPQLNFSTISEPSLTTTINLKNQYQKKLEEEIIFRKKQILNKLNRHKEMMKKLKTFTSQEKVKEMRTRNKKDKTNSSFSFSHSMFETSGYRGCMEERKAKLNEELQKLKSMEKSHQYNYTESNLLKGISKDKDRQIAVSNNKNKSGKLNIVEKDDKKNKSNKSIKISKVKDNKDSEKQKIVFDNISVKTFNSKNPQIKSNKGTEDKKAKLNEQITSPKEKEKIKKNKQPSQGKAV